MSVTNFRIPRKMKNKLEQEYLQDEEAMKQDAFLRKEFFEEAARLEAEAADLELDIPEEVRLQDSKDMLDRILSAAHADPKLAAILQQPVGAALPECFVETQSEQMDDSEEDVEELILLGRALKESGKTLEDIVGEDELSEEANAASPHSQKKKGWSRRARVMAGAAASILILFTFSMSSEAMRNFLLHKTTWLFANKPVTTVTHSENFIEDREYAEAIGLVKTELGVPALCFEKSLEGMSYEEVFLDKEAHYAKIIYKYENKIITVLIDSVNGEMSMSRAYDGELLDVCAIPLWGLEVEIRKIQRDDDSMAFYADLSYGEGFYSIIADVEEEEFRYLVNNISFI